jgi:hypothetical protein
MKPTKRGRPPLPEGLSKDSRLVLRITANEDAAIERAAIRAGKKKSDWAREALMDAATGKPQKRPAKKGTGSILTEIGVPSSERAEREDQPKPEHPLISPQNEPDFLD